MKSYTHLSAKERQKIECFSTNGLSVRAIARTLGRSHKTISRELRRCKCYQWQEAEAQYRRLRFNKAGKIARDQWLQDHIFDRLSDKWSPEQISGRLKYENQHQYVCHRTIYLYANKDKALRKLLPDYNKRWYFRNNNLTKAQQNLPSVHDRDDIAEPKSWEADLVRFGKTVQNVTTLFNRHSKLVRLIKNIDGRVATVLSGLSKHVEDIKILTLDRGSEFVRVSWFYDNGIRPYYCDPMSPGQKGGCENTNRRLRRYLPKRTDISLYDQRAIDNIERKMNNTPRKCLGYLTPSERHEQIIKLAHFKL